VIDEGGLISDVMDGLLAAGVVFIEIGHPVFNARWMWN
jgi:hypothetical protein